MNQFLKNISNSYFTPVLGLTSRVYIYILTKRQTTILPPPPQFDRGRNNKLLFIYYILYLSEFGNHPRGSFITYTCQSMTTYIITVIIITSRRKTNTALNIQISVSSIKHNKSGLIGNLSNSYTFQILTIVKYFNTKMPQIYKIVSKSQMSYNCAPTRVCRETMPYVLG